MDDGILIETKLSIPRTQSGLIDRDQLTARLSAGKDKRMTVVTGLAGSGKTCLTIQWIRAAGLKAVWYSLDETDNDSDLFFRYLLSTIGRINEQAALIVGPTLDNQKRIQQRKIVALFEKCFQTLSEDCFLVLDDYHYIKNQVIHDVISTIAKYSPEKCHFVIISRSTLPLAIADLKLKNQINEIPAGELKFTDQEAQAYFSTTFPVGLSPNQISELNNYWEGWVGGLQLFGIYLNRVKAWDRLKDIRTKASREAMIFLIDQVINTQPAAIREFIRYTAVLDRFNADLCHAVTGAKDALNILRLIQANNLFITPLNDEHTWFRYHHVLSETLETQLKQDAFEKYQSIHRTASRWFAGNNLYEDAFRHAYASEDIEFIGDMLEDFLPELYDQYEVATYRRWLAKFPHTTFLQRPLLRLYECRNMIESLRLLEAKSTLEHLEKAHTPFERYSKTKQKLCEDYLTFLTCRLNYWMDPLTVDVSRHEKLLEHIDPKNEMFQNFIRAEMAASYFLKGEMADAKTALQDMSVVVLASESSRVKITWFRLMIAVERKMGRLERATALLKDANYYINQMGLSEASIKCMLYIETAWLAFFQGDLNRAGTFADMAVSYLDEATGYEHEILEGNFIAALVHMANDETAMAEQRLQRIKRTAKVSDNAYVVSMSNALCARLSTALGDLEWPRAWSQQRNLHLDESFSFLFVHECLGHAELFIAGKEFTAALQLLDTLHARCSKRQLIEITFIIDLLRCVALVGAGKKKTADALFENLFTYAVNEGYVMPLVGFAKDLPALFLAQAKKIQPQHLTSPTHSNILKACGMAQDHASPSISMENELTRREEEILHLLAEGFKYSEIADQSYISIDTVRTHIKHVYAKLGVNTKVAAIKKAQHYGILTSR